ncbi:MAG: bifunctional proline dehydrogenase/L-glutamate gamma-semialdehyde dehydrogenase PutA [Pseudomonadales bacterium]|nr:bifunctional proline dehydrogenase/L-glutamate gamma-semialdehyde dehydrogenase PutA [Pseudomonadales bacterium]
MASGELPREVIAQSYLRSEREVLERLIAEAAIPPARCAEISRRAAELIGALREEGRPGLMEVFLEEYGLSTDEGVALMCLAEALLRVPDADTIDALIEDKIAPSSWGEHLGRSSSSLVNASTWALMLTGRVLDDQKDRGMAGIMRSAVRRLGEPVIRAAVKRAMKELGSQFVLGQTIEAAMQRAAKQEAHGYTYSYDMLGEAALTWRDADAYFDKYRLAIAVIASNCDSEDPRCNPGISIKLSALHPRYEVSQAGRVMRELVPRVSELALLARAAGIGLTIDAEEADRLELSLDIIEAVFADGRLAGWDGFGVVVQAYGKRVGAVIDWLYALAARHGRRMMIRLVKGAYWDSEIKHAQTEGLAAFPVFTTKAATDVAYICCVQKLLRMTHWLYPQFATHNAHTMTAVLALAGDRSTFEFQRLHGMGGALHELVMAGEKTACRIYAPVGIHRDLLAYLVRRLLENGANSSFVNQVVDEDVPADVIAADPFTTIAAQQGLANPAVVLPAAIYEPGRSNSQGWDLRDRADLNTLEAARRPFADHSWRVVPAEAIGAEQAEPRDVINPARPNDRVGSVVEVTPDQVEAALQRARSWTEISANGRAAILRRAADLYEDNTGELLAALAREAGKTLADAVGELREAVDFLRFYAQQAEQLRAEPRGLFTCISPWNFPLAIFTGQVAAALAAGNGVLAKPAEATPITAMLAVRLLHAAGVPDDVLQLLPGGGADVGAALTSDPRIGGVCFTGSTATAWRINRAIAAHLNPAAPLIAETGGLNAMVVDSTALPEQAVRDIVASAFQSAGQRCSALRILYLQEDIAAPMIDMLKGAMGTLQLGDPWQLVTDIGPVISEQARRGMDRHIEIARREGRVLKELPRARSGFFVGPTLIKVGGIADLDREVFGPVLHVATFKASELAAVAQAINARGYGLTFGLHTRIDDRVESLTRLVKAGNTYVNRNQIGAVVGSQPFGGEGLSGTGPKAGGPNYLRRFTRYPEVAAAVPGEQGPLLAATAVQAALASLVKKGGGQGRGASLQTLDLPGPTGESNRLSLFGRGTVLCLGPTAQQARDQAQIARANGCSALEIAPGASGKYCLDGRIAPSLLTELAAFELVAFWGGQDEQAALRQALAARDGPIIALVTHLGLADHCILERHVCIDTTAAGGNASLLAAVGDAIQ